MIKIIDLHKSFADQQVLKGVNLEIADKELVAIIGQSGGGKSVFLRHLIGLLKPDKGSIIIDGVDITKVNRKELDLTRQKFGVVFQGGALFDSVNIYDNVAFPLREKLMLKEDVIKQKVTEILEEVGLVGIEKKYPAEISGGMRKRVALARALVTEPKIVLFDEPTTGLDPILLHSIHNLIIDTHKKYGFTGVIISHDIPEIFDVVDRVAFLYKGKIVEVGTPKEIQNSTNPVSRHFITGKYDGSIEFFN
ncbi:MAG: ABC transporter ATP-binding protein [Thermodesulfovibrionales bacterium]|nr:ABC transporter ATP-binding protein [Thermodesulfovibrionales bacterium]